MTRAPTISTYNNNKEEQLTFTLENCNVSIANAIRRIVLSDINTYVFKTFPHAENRANFTVNTTRLHNELLKQRLGCIPIHHVHTIEGFQNDYKNYVVEVDVKNESDTIRYVTTEDFKVKRAKNIEKSGGSHDDDDVVYEYLPESTVRKIFPPDSVSGEYIEFARLLPKLSSNVPFGEALAFTCTIEISNAKFDGMYNVAHTCAYNCTPDEKEIEKQWKAMEKGLREGFESGSSSAHASVSTVAEQLASAKKNWELLDAQRVFVNDSFDFVIETVGVYTNVQLVTKSCDIMIKKCEKLLADMEHSSSSGSSEGGGTETKFGIKNIIEPGNELTTMKNAFCINLIGEDYTLGKAVEFLLYSNYYDKPDGIVSFCGFKKPHPHALDSFILVAFKEETDISKVQDESDKKEERQTVEMYSKIGKTGKSNGNNGDNDSQGNHEKKKFHGPYSSNVFNAPIVNTITGVKYPWTVGSFGESFLWKVVNTTQFEPKLYFYDSPEQYEEHRRVKIDPEAKTAWHRLQQRLGSGYE